MTTHASIAATSAFRGPYAQTALVFPGGGALGAYEAGVYQALAEAGCAPALALRHLDRGNQRGDYRGERAGYAAASSTPVLEAVDIIISLASARLWRRHAALVQLHELHLLFAFGPARILPAPFHTPVFAAARHFPRAQCLRYEPAADDAGSARRFRPHQFRQDQAIARRRQHSSGQLRLFRAASADCIRHEVKNRKNNSRWISYRRVFTQPGPTVELG